MDDKARILWALAFMKCNRAALFIDCILQTYHVMGTLPYESWEEFSTIFVTEFCPKNKVQVAWEFRLLSGIPKCRGVHWRFLRFSSTCELCRRCAHHTQVSTWTQPINPRWHCPPDCCTWLEPHPPKSPSPLVDQCKPTSLQPSALVWTFRDAMIGTPMVTNNCFTVLMVEELESPISELIIQLNPSKERPLHLQPHLKWKRWLPKCFRIAATLSMNSFKLPMSLQTTDTRDIHLTKSRLWSFQHVCKLRLCETKVIDNETAEPPHSSLYCG